MRKMVKAKVIEEKFEDINYFIWTKDFKEHKRGCIDIDGLHIHSYPSIKRVINLEKGVKKSFKKPFYVQEKVDGYNVRVVMANNEIYAFSRSGHIEAFATEKLRENEAIKKIAKDGFIICGEMIGNTPYTTSYQKHDYDFFVFDIIKDGKFLEVEELYKLANHYGFKTVPLYGIFDPRDENSIASLKGLIKKLNEEKKEGIVMKNSETRIKYVFGYNELFHFANAFMAPFDYNIGYIQQRISRAALFFDEFNIKVPENEEFNPIKNLIESIKMFKDKGYVSKIFRIKVKAITTWIDIKKRLEESKEIKIKELDIKQIKENGKNENAYYEITFEKIFNRTTKKLRPFITGKAFED
jgi:putative ATP-dependent DNA ligase